MQQFTKETGIDVEVTLSNNEEMISKLRATRARASTSPSRARTASLGPQQEFGIYKPLDLSKLKAELFIALDARGDEEEHHASTARSTACRTSGAPTASS